RVLIREHDKIMEKVMDPRSFWKIIMTFCDNSTKEIHLDKVEEFYQLFLGKYLKYSSGHGYSFQLDQFNQMCDNWIQHTVRSSTELTLDQIILEVLAIHPGITLAELVNRVAQAGSRTEEVEKTLSYYTPMPPRPAFIDVYG